MMSKMALIAAILLLSATGASALRPTTGKPVDELSFLDDTIHAFMDTTSVKGIVLGVSHHGRIVYLRGFGWDDQALTSDLQETAVMRVASITKTFTAAVIRDLIAKDQLDPGDFAFDLGQLEGGVLPVSPFPSQVDDRLGQITIEHLIVHEGGWDREDAEDYTTMELQIQSDMSLADLPDREETMDWILGRPLVNPPGTYHYSNEGYLALGLIAEHVSGTDLLSYVRTHLLPEDLWYPMTDIFMGRSLLVFQDPREPYYDTSRDETNVFDPEGPLVHAPYGSWNHEVRDGQGRIVAGAVPLLHQAHRFQLNGPERGAAIGDLHGTWNHGGALPGSNALLRQREDGVDYVVLTNRRDDDTPAADLKPVLDAVFDANPFPALDELVDCRWMDFGHGGDEWGSYDEPYDAVGDLGVVPAWTKVRIKPGSSPWTGEITHGHLMLLGTREGSAIIGK